MTTFYNVSATVRSAGMRFAFFTVEHNGRKMDCIIRPDVAAKVLDNGTGDLVVGRKHLINYVEGKDGRLTTVKLHRAGTNVAPMKEVEKVVDRAKDGSWSIEKHPDGTYNLIQKDEEPQPFASMTDAQRAVGKTPQAPTGNGVKTNDPTLSQRMQRSSTGGGKKAA